MTHSQHSSWTVSSGKVWRSLWSSCFGRNPLPVCCLKKVEAAGKNASSCLGRRWRGTLHKQTTAAETMTVSVKTKNQKHKLELTGIFLSQTIFRENVQLSLNQKNKSRSTALFFSQGSVCCSNYPHIHLDTQMPSPAHSGGSQTIPRRVLWSL